MPRTARSCWTLAGFLLLLPRPAAAATCGSADCGPHGECDTSALLARCECEPGYTSVSTFLEPSSLGAYCVRLSALPDTPGCTDLQCAPHGVCVIADLDGGPRAQCACDPGFKASAGGCEDDPDDEREAVCANVECGEDASCMATDDAVTCRCKGASVVLGAGKEEGFGPVCSAAPDPKTACGPDACGPYGECVILQALFCSCDEGAEVEELKAGDGKLYPYCVKPGEPLPNDPDSGLLRRDASTRDAGTRDAGPDPSQARATYRGGGACRLARRIGESGQQRATVLFAALALIGLRRGRRTCLNRA